MREKKTGCGPHYYNRFMDLKNVTDGNLKFFFEYNLSLKKKNKLGHELARLRILQCYVL